MTASDAETFFMSKVRTPSVTKNPDGSITSSTIPASTYEGQAPETFLDGPITLYPDDDGYADLEELLQDPLAEPGDEGGTNV